MSAPYISTTEAAELIGVSPRTIRHYIAQGTLTGYRIGPRILRVSRAEVEALLEPIPTAAGVGGGAVA